MSAGCVESLCRYEKEQMKRVAGTLLFTVQHQTLMLKSGQALCDSAKPVFFTVSVERDRAIQGLDNFGLNFLEGAVQGHNNYLDCPWLNKQPVLKNHVYI